MYLHLNGLFMRQGDRDEMSEYAILVNLEWRMYHQGKIVREGRSCEADVRVVHVSLRGWCSVKPESTVSGSVVLHFKMPLFFI